MVEDGGEAGLVPEHVIIALLLKAGRRGEDFIPRIQILRGVRVAGRDPGGGDIKLCAAAGLMLGWQNMLVAIMIALITGGGYGIWLLASGSKGRKEHFAFGPFLVLGIAVALLYGNELISWYLGLFGLV